MSGGLGGRRVRRRGLLPTAPRSEGGSAGSRPPCILRSTPPSCGGAASRSGGGAVGCGGGVPSSSAHGTPHDSVAAGGAGTRTGSRRTPSGTALSSPDSHRSVRHCRSKTMFVSILGIALLSSNPFSKDRGFYM